MPKRQLLVPTKTISKADFMALQAKWDRRLKRAGFQDIEYGQDTNRLDASTFRGGNDPHAVYGSVVSRSTNTGPDARSSNGRADVFENVFSSPRARAWMRFSQAANDLPTDRRTREILVEVGQTGVIRAVARRRKLSVNAVYRLALRLCDAIDLDHHLLFGTSLEVTEGDELATAERGHPCAACGRRFRTHRDDGPAPDRCPRCRGARQAGAPWWCRPCRTLADRGETGGCPRHARAAETVAA